VRSAGVDDLGLLTEQTKEAPKPPTGQPAAPAAAPGQ
jgi:hypothetical protein